MNSDKWILVRGARQLLTLHHHRGPLRAGEPANLGVIPDGSVLLHNDIIEAVGPTRRVENMAQARSAEEIDAAGRVVMPAFVDPYASLVPVPSCEGTSARTIQNLSANRLEAQAQDLLKTMACHGTATIGAVCGCAPDGAGELKILRAVAALNNRPLDIVSILAVAQPPLDGQEFLQCIKHRKLAGVVQASCHPNAASFLSTAHSLGFAVRLATGPEHITGLVDAAIGLQALAISINQPITPAEVESLSFSPSFAVLMPALWPSDEPPLYAWQLVDRNGLIALASGLNPETGATASMQAVVQMACRRFGLTIDQAIPAATINAAWALGAAWRAGSLEHGKNADLLLLNASDYREIPLLEGTNLVHMTIKRGVVVFKEDFPGWPTPR